jgi:hypothetical protein
VGKSHLAAKIIENVGLSHLMGTKETTRAEVAAYFIEYEDLDTPTVSESNIDSTKNGTTAAITPVTTSTNGETDEKQVKADGKDETSTNPENVPKETTTTDDQGLTEDDDLHSEFVASILRTMAWQLSEDDKKYEKFLTDHIKATEENCKAGTPDIEVRNLLRISS